MVLTWLREIREHRWLALRAIVVGWVAWWVLWIVASWLVLDFDDWLFVGGVADIRWFWRILRTPFFHILVGAAVAAGTGWLVGRSDREHRVPMVLLFFISHMIIGDLPRFIPAALTAFGPGQGRLWWIVVSDFVFMRVPIVMAGICLTRGTSTPGQSWRM
jgi:hypothetical protein